MNERALERGGETDPGLISVAVGVPGIFGHPWDYLSLMKIPEGMDLTEEWRKYNFSGGRIYRYRGTTLDHDTVMFDRWLVSWNCREGVSCQALASLPKGVDPQTIEFQDGLNAESYFVPDFAELNPHLR